MPSNFTKNYSLSQWERSDKVLMDDFNADNAKIDAALAFHPSAELICSVTVEEETTQLELDISQVDWSRYMALALMVDTEQYNGFSINMPDGAQCVYIMSQGQSIHHYSSFAECNYASHMALLIPVFYDSRHPALALEFSLGRSFSDGSSSQVASLCAGGGTSHLKDCRTLSVHCPKGSFAPGSRVVLWGVK